ncbi:sulfatase-like hydrolase/transferase, partial [Candidatus Sumerlaeota bacterium]|nr:sulfatase-like hydrolase/transferase [Candidatus Sumerlaeota bacterium]
MKRKVGRRWTFALALMMTIAGCAGWWNKEPARESAATGAPKPNVLFLHIDDLNNRLGCYGDPLVQSPNIDRLAARGLRFDMAYCQYPLCNPSRTSMLTSLLPEVTRITDNETAPRSMMPDMISMPQYFQTQGYYAASVGKIFHTPFPDAKSWNEELKWSGATPKGKRNAGGMARGAKRKPPRAAAKRAKREGKQSGGDVNSRWEATRGGDEQEEDGVSARAAAEFLARKHDKPFFLAVGFRKPH